MNIEYWNNRLGTHTMGKASIIEKDGITYIRYPIYHSYALKNKPVETVYIPIESECELEKFCLHYAKLYDLPTILRIYVFKDDDNHMKETQDECTRLFYLGQEKNNYSELFTYLKDWSVIPGTILYPVNNWEVLGFGWNTNNILYPETNGYPKHIYEFINELGKWQDKKYSTHASCGTYYGKLSKVCLYSVEMYTGYNPSMFTIDQKIECEFGRKFLSRGGVTLRSEYCNMDFDVRRNLVHEHLKKYIKSKDKDWLRYSFLEFIKK